MEIRMAKEGDMPRVFALRFEVFVSEQGVPAEIELDAEDAHAMHIIAEEEGRAIGCARVIFTPGEAHIGRLAVRKSHRGKGIGSAVCRFAIDCCRKQGCSYIWLNSQLHAVGFYEALGFCSQGDTFFEAGLEHVKMVMGSGENQIIKG